MRYLKLYEMYSKEEELEKFLSNLGIYKFLEFVNDIITNINDDVFDLAEVSDFKKSKLNINLVPKKKPMNLKTLEIDFTNNSLNIDNVKKNDFFKFLENIKYSNKIIFSINYKYEIYVGNDINEQLSKTLDYYKNICEFNGYDFNYISGVMYFISDLNIKRYIKNKFTKLDMRKSREDFGFMISSEVDSDIFLQEIDTSFLDNNNKEIIEKIISKYKITKIDKELLVDIIKESI